MTCCARAIADQFGRDTADEELRRYRRDGALPTTRALVDAVRAQGIEQAELIDIGAGVGAVQHALLEGGAARAVHIDISAAYIAAAREEAARRGHATRVQFIEGDFVELAPTVEAADIVTLDRVICCYPDMERLVARSAEKARRVYGAVYPRDVWWTRAGLAAQNLVKRLRRSAFRAYVHSPDAIDAVLRRAGFARRRTERTWLWEVVVYVRTG